jgi:uncharacterized membrane protein YfcA
VIEPLVLSGLAAVSLLAGFVDAIAGGGGLIQLPPLLAVLGPRTAPGVNKVASISGTTAAVVRYARNGNVRWRLAAVAAPVAAAGSLAASLAYLRVVRDAEGVVKPVFAACFLLLAVQQIHRALRKGHAERVPHAASPAVGFPLVLGIGAYDGFVGPGTGMFFFWALTTWFALPPLDATGTAKVLNLATNAGALVAFVAGGAVIWPVALVLAAANLTGGWLGAHTAIRRGVRFIRIVTGVVSVAAAAWLLFRG